MHSYRNTSSIVDDRERTIFIDDDFNMCAIACQVLIDRIVNDLPYQVMKTFNVGASNIHSRPLSDRFQSLQRLNAVGAITTLLFVHIFYLQNEAAKVQKPN